MDWPTCSMFSALFKDCGRPVMCIFSVDPVASNIQMYLLIISGLGEN